MVAVQSEGHVGLVTALSDGIWTANVSMRMGSWSRVWSRDSGDQIRVIELLSIMPSKAGSNGKVSLFPGQQIG